EAQTSLASKRADDLKERARKLSITTGFAADGAWDSGKVAEATEYLNGIARTAKGWRAAVRTAPSRFGMLGRGPRSPPCADMGPSSSPSPSVRTAGDWRAAVGTTRSRF